MNGSSMFIFFLLCFSLCAVFKFIYVFCSMVINTTQDYFVWNITFLLQYYFYFQITPETLHSFIHYIIPCVPVYSLTYHKLFKLCSLLVKFLLKSASMTPARISNLIPTLKRVKVWGQKSIEPLRLGSFQFSWAMLVKLGFLAVATRQ